MAESRADAHWRVARFALAMLLLSGATLARAEPKCGEESGDAAELAAVWQEIDAACGCSPATTEDWKPGAKAFNACSKGVVLQAVVEQRVRAKCKRTLISGAKKSTCARPPEWTTCCLTNQNGKTSCKVRKTTAACATTGSKYAELGSTETCMDACDAANGPECWEDTDCDDGNSCTIEWCELSEGCQGVEIPNCDPDNGGNGGSGGTSCSGNGNATHGLSSGEQTLLGLVNDYRASQGSPPVTVCTSLTVSAQDHANDMRNRGYFAHQSQNGMEFWERACAAGYTNGCVPNTYMGEIIAGYDSTPSGIMNQWLNSPGHEVIMGSSLYNVVGIGHACGGPFGHYWVMDFAGANEPSCN